MASESADGKFICAHCLKDGETTVAVTAVEGTLMCAEHALDAITMHRMRHD